MTNIVRVGAPNKVNEADLTDSIINGLPHPNSWRFTAVMNDLVTFRMETDIGWTFLVGCTRKIQPLKTGNFPRILRSIVNMLHFESFITYRWASHSRVEDRRAESAPLTDGVRLMSASRIFPCLFMGMFFVQLEDPK
ncbi:hypothetical protein PAAG_02493 [Paracoccidioides lutzii Pb01]|uniref:Uncharacterized protein n=1 Tax=Paracoccidioides lutzii (strain ATCC MYA-826 / Pb01) TaxID=502779 RepID=C1GV20_PARBA|nr:hypothetical protein PAAG_02493 [Paracoccidioides lutzii Pb01]EEH40438.2 hypothetical protein PAAG_02493 [Paracoccidioides lutzii Pb01]